MNSMQAFKQISSQEIPALNITLEEYEHNVTGAKHYHLASDNTENVFLVALRTVPEDSRGVAHILEHTALCGSNKYPVRDPFFMMIRRSLNTFMNAFTSSDWTAYPFASQNRKDFDNLLNVYMDAVFFSRLDPLDFAQEGHRIEFEDADDPSTPLVYKGVVFNEMKGAMSSITSQLWHTLCKYLYPTSTYHYNSGGDPEHIPELSYEQLKEFYKTHYHPSNAMFLTYGDITAIEHQEKFEALALNKFEALGKEIGVTDEKRYPAPQRVVEFYPTDDENTDNKTHFIMGWLLGKSTNLEDLLQAQLLSNVLLDNSSSPLLHLLESTDYGTAPSPLCGLEDSNRELSFSCGIEGSNPDDADAIEAMILGKLEALARDGVEHERLESVLHQLEFHHREIGGDGYPYGLQIIMAALGAATHRGSPAEVLDIEPVLATLRERIKQPGYLQGLIKTLLLDNTHRVTLLMQPDPTLSDIRDKSEKARLEKIRQNMDEKDIERVVKLAADLQKRQLEEDDASILPKVSLSDVPEGIKVLPSVDSNIGPSKLPLSYFPQGTNGILYQQLLLPIPDFSADERQLLPLFTSLMTELGIADLGYLQTQALQAATCGSLSAFSSIRSLPNSEQDMRGFIVLSAKALQSNAEKMSQLLKTTFEQAKFSETGRIKELIAQITARREQSITGNGHALAMSAACSGMSPGAALSYQHGGMAGIRWLKTLNANIDDAQLDILSAQLSTMHTKLLKQNRQMLVVGESEQQQSVTTMVEQHFSNMPAKSNLTLENVRHTVRLAWQAETQVNFCAKAFPTVTVSHEDSAALTVLAGFLRNGFLHRSIREQGGAYGGGATHDAASASFRFYSYRDPRLSETINDFDASVQWLLNSKHKWQGVEEAILGVVSSIDKPGSPAGEAKQQYHSQLFDRTPEQRQAFRARVLAVTANDLQRVGERYLTDQKSASVAIVSNESNLNANEQWCAEQGLKREVL